MTLRAGSGGRYPAVLLERLIFLSSIINQWQGRQQVGAMLSIQLMKRNLSNKQLKEPIYKIRKPKALAALSELQQEYQSFSKEFNAEAQVILIKKTRNIVNQIMAQNEPGPEIDLLSDEQRSILKHVSSLESLKGMPRNASIKEKWNKKRLNLTSMNNTVQVSKLLNDSICQPPPDIIETEPFNIFDTGKLPLDRDQVQRKYRLKGNDTNNSISNYDLWDDQKTNEEWWKWCEFTGGPHAECPFYVGGVYTRKLVNVVGFDKERDRFIVSQPKSDLHKQVIRLSLRFLSQPEDKYLERVELCKLRQRAANNQRRFEAYVQSIPDDKVTQMGQNYKRRIILRTLKKNDISQVKSNEIRQLNANLLQSQALFRNYMKKFLVLDSMARPQNKEKWVQLRISNHFQPKRYPAFGRIFQHSYGFQSIRTKLMEQLIQHKDIVVYNTFKSIVQRRISSEQHVLVDLKPNPHNLPVSLLQFQKRQTEHFNLNLHNLVMQMRDYVISNIMDQLGQLFQFYQTQSDQYYKSQLPRLIKCIDQMLCTFLRQDFLRRNLQLWKNWLYKYVASCQNSEQNFSQPLLMLQLVISDKIQHQKQKKRKKKKTQKNEDLQEEETMGELIFYQPPIAKVIECFLQPLIKIELQLKAMVRIEPEVVPLIEMEKIRPCVDLQQERPFILSIHKEIRQYIEKAFIKPDIVLERFKKFTCFIDGSNMKLIKVLFKDVNFLQNLNREQIRNSMQNLSSSMKIVSNLEIDECKSGLFLIQTKATKDIILKNIQEQMDSILSGIINLINNNVNQVTKKFSDLRSDLTSPLKDEQALQKLLHCMAQHEIYLARLKNQIANIQSYVLYLEQYGKRFDCSDFFRLYEKPNKIKEAVLEGIGNASVSRNKFQATLQTQMAEFNNDIADLKQRYQEIKDIEVYEYKNNYVENAKKVNEFDEKLNEGISTTKKFNERERIFQQAQTNYSDLQKINESFQPYLRMWRLITKFQNQKFQTLDTHVTKLNAKSYNSAIKSLFEESIRIIKQFQELQDAKYIEIAEQVKIEVQAFKQLSWLIDNLSIQIMQQKRGVVYWKQIFKECGVGDLELDETLNLAKLIQKGIDQHRPIIEQICSKADKQYQLEKKLNQMTQKLRDKKLQFTPYKNTGMFLLKPVDQIITYIDQQLIALAMMKASPYIKPHLSKANSIQAKMTHIEQGLDGWIKCQRGWMYLEPIFSSDDIKQKLAQQKSLFDQVDAHLRGQVKQMMNEPMFYDQIEGDKTKEDFDRCNKMLDRIQKSLSDYLQTKRKYFPRFFFLSDQELLQILAQTKDPLTVQKHISKCFEAISALIFTKSQQVTGMVSSQKESVNYIKSIDVNEGQKKGNVQIWLHEIENVMIKTLKKITEESEQDDDTERNVWIRKYQAQPVLAVNMIRWTHSAEAALIDKHSNSHSVEQYYQFLNQQLRHTVDMVRQQLTDLQRMTLGSLVVIDVHARDVIGQLMSLDVSSCMQFEWIAQLRYYSETVNKNYGINVKMINAVLKYGFQYLGNSARLVITPLTDRCYRTLMGAFHLYYGGAPEGPAGTGKTQTVKDLAKAMAVPCVVFNCSDGLNYLAMRKFFKGLASSGAWCCFDEFNRIDLQVLSVIAQQVLSIQDAVRDKRKKFLLDGEEIDLITSCAINITMNPGYAGRSQLPDNLKALFRPCAMMVPDYALIAQIYLYSVGFQEARNLARKIVASLKLSSQQLSSQDHYDFGMRALKAILTASGNLKRVMTESEEIICLRALKDVNIPKFTYNDVPLFNSITSDLFPGVVQPPIDYGLIKNALILCAQQKRLTPQTNFVNKCIQLYDTINVRHGLMVVGGAFTGKSTVIELLKLAMSSLKGKKGFFETKIFKLNPKAVTSDQLYGKLDPITRSWFDGVVAIIMRLCAGQYQIQQKKWVVFDGPVDAVWIQNMNTVLDDNKKLCLTSGEIIKLTNWMTMMFQVQDLAQASPATVSRCGMVFLDNKQLTWLPIIKNYIYSLPETLDKKLQHIQNLVVLLADCCLAWIRKYAKFPVHKIQMNFVDSYVKLIKAQMADIKMDKIPKDFDQIFGNMVLFAGLWSFGAAIEQQSRKKMSQFMLRLITADYTVVDHFNLELTFPFKPVSIKAKIPQKVNIFDMCFIQNKGWVTWNQTKPPFVVPKGGKYNSIKVPTSDSIRNSHLIQLLVASSIHILLTGPTGTGKTSNVLALLNQCYMNSEYTFLNTAFSGQTSANQIQTILQGKINYRKRKGVFGPEDRKNYIVVFIDDLSMPIKEKYGAQPPIQLLRQWMDMRGWYDLQTKQFKEMVGIVWIGAMLPPSGRNTITNRYMRHFNLLYAQPYQNQSLMLIFTNLMDWYFTNLPTQFSKAITNLSELLVKSTIEIYNQIQVSKELLPTPAKSHYIYNLRDISKVFQGLTKANTKGIRDQNQFIKLWLHQTMRVFKDRLIDYDDHTYFDGMLKNVLLNNFKKEWSQLVQLEPLIFASFVPTVYPDGDTSRKQLRDVYCQLTDRDNVKKVCNRLLQEYSAYIGNRMNLVLFMAAIQHIIRVARVLQTDYGHLLLVGVGGSGRKSMAKLGTFISFSNESVQINEKNWIEQLQGIMKIAGTDNKQLGFIFTDSQIINESMLEDICNLLNNGQIPNLYRTKEEKVKALDEETHAGLDNEKFLMFLSRCKDNLHLILCMSPVGQAFRTRLRTFPSLVNCTTIDWYMAWPQEALRSTASSHISQEMKIKQEPMLSSLVDICVDMQTRMRNMSTQYFQELRRYYYVTPTSYLQLLNIFQTLLTKRKKTVGQLIANYQNGVLKIQSTQNDIAKMKIQLTALQPKLVQSTEDNKVMLVNLTKKRKQADSKRALCQADEKVCNGQRQDANKLMIQCQIQLDKVKPILESAIKALDSVTSKEIQTIKSYKQPPSSVLCVLEGLCYAFNEDSQVKFVPKEPGSMQKYQDFWDYSKRNLLNSKLIGKIKSYDQKKILEIPPKKIEKLKILMDKPEFREEVVTKASQAAGSLSKWIRAIVNTFNALLIVKPKQAQLNESKQRLAEAEAALAQKKQLLQEVMNLLSKLQKDYQTTKKQKQDLQNKINKVRNQLEIAQKLISGLKSQKQNWKKKAIDFRNQEKSILGDILLCSGFIAYLGAFPAAYRENALEKWKELMTAKDILFSKDFGLQKILSDPITIGKWTSQDKLPNDSFSIDNAIIYHNSSRWPLMIDPQNQATLWIKTTYPSTTLHIIKPNQDNIRLLQNVVGRDHQVLLVNAGQTFDSVLQPILQKKIIKSGIGWQIKLDSAPVDYDPNFKLLITTKMSRPHYSPDVCVKVTMLNFQVTQEGLQDQMLNIVVKSEQPMKQQQRQKNIRQFYENKIRQKATEEMILSGLYNSKNNILDDERLILMLEKSKIESSQIQEKLKKQEFDKQQFNNIRNFYREVAKRSANLYFVVLDLALIQPTYQWSLEFYTTLFQTSITRSPPGKQNRCPNIIKTFTQLLYESITRSLLQKDKLIFSLTMCFKVMIAENKLNTVQLRFVMMGSSDAESAPNQPQKPWMTPKLWANLNQFSKIFGLQTFTANFSKELDDWNSYIFDQNPWQPVKPPKSFKSMSQFMRLAIVRLVRPEKFIEGCQNLIIQVLGKKYIEPPAFNLQNAIMDSNSLTPLIFILSPGADPRLEIYQQADIMGFKNNFQMISLGQGQQELASNAIKKASQGGFWLLLQNCHLAPSFMPRMQKIIQELTNVHSSFRLWLTLMPSNVFPVSVLMRGIKMTYEPPRGLKSSLLRSFSTVQTKTFQDCKKPGEWKKLFFGLSFFHALILERRKFGPLGWNIPYQFTVPDFTISMNQLKMFLNEWEEIPWKALNYMVAQANYGGRVTDPQDRRLIKTILKQFYSQGALKDNFRIFDSDTYKIPLPGNLASMVQHVKAFPLNDKTEVFGLHSNAQITFALLQTNNTCQVVLSLLPRNSGTSGQSQQEILKAKIQNMIKKLPQSFDVQSASKKHPVLYQQSMNTVLQQELIRFNKLLNTVRSSLNNLEKAIDGLVVFSADLQQLSDSIFDNKVPEMWHKVSYPSVKGLGSWLLDLVERLKFMDKWINKGKPGSFWISGFFFTQSFLTGVLQNYARKCTIPIDTLFFTFIVKQELIPQYQDEGPEDGCYIHGLFLDGARWDEVRKCLTDPAPKILNSEMPLIWFKPVDTKTQQSRQLYSCPVYKTSQRRGTLSTTGHSTNYVLSITLPVQDETDSDFWVKRGTALLTQLDD